MNRFAGYKTYLVAAAAALTIFAQSLGWITPEIANQILAVLGVGAVAALKHGQNRIEKGL